jgi:hypothetical protein
MPDPAESCSSYWPIPAYPDEVTQPSLAPRSYDANHPDERFIVVVIECREFSSGPG